MGNFQNLRVWQLAKNLAVRIYKLTRNPKLSKDFGLKDQIRRASVSIVSNIAEGFERESNNQFVYFLIIAKGSAGELRAQLYIAKNQNYITSAEFEDLKAMVLEVSKTIGGFVSYLKTQKKNTQLSKLS